MNRITTITRLDALKQFVRFLLSGGAAALANFGSRFVFSKFFPYVPSVTLAFFVGLLTGFILMRLFVFVDAGKLSPRQIGYYIVVNILALGITVIVSLTVVRMMALVIPDLKIAEAVGHFFGVCAPVLVSFYAHKNLTFR